MPERVEAGLGNAGRPRRRLQHSGEDVAGSRKVARSAFGLSTDPNEDTAESVRAIIHGASAGVDADDRFSGYRIHHNLIRSNTLCRIDFGNPHRCDPRAGPMEQRAAGGADDRPDPLELVDVDAGIVAAPSRRSRMTRSTCRAFFKTMRCSPCSRAASRRSWCLLWRGRRQESVRHESTPRPQAAHPMAAREIPLGMRFEHGGPQPLYFWMRTSNPNSSIGHMRTAAISVSTRPVVFRLSK
jgi:hypothetical protein